LAHLSKSEKFLSAWMPEEAQICNPWHVKALVAACERGRVRMLPSTTISEFNASTHELKSIRVAGEQIEFDVCVFACGAWTQNVTKPFIDCVQMVPVRGQMILYRLDAALELPVINEGTRYIVPRNDGHVLVGATIEEVGFDESTTDSEIGKLAADAQRLVPSLTREKIVKTWAGLRPGTHDGFPYMGRLPSFDNVFVSTGHFKIGLQLSTGSAVAMADLIENKPTLVDLTPFDPSRVLV
jgi:glycine oxidase